MRIRISLIFLATLFPVSLYPQDIKNLQATFMESEYFFMSEDYIDALPLYLSLYEKMNDNSNLAYRIGLCYLNIPGKKNLSVDFLEIAVKDLSAQVRDGSINQKSAPYDALFELGRAYRINYMFDKAKECFQKFYNTLLPDDYENLAFVKNELRVCETASQLISKPVGFSEENLGDPINTKESDFNPVISADGKSFMFMVSMKFYNAVMYSRYINNKWSDPVNITPELEVEGDIYISSLSSDGKILFLSVDDNYNSDIYYSSFNGTTWSKITKCNRNINTKYWESHGFITEDGNRLIFASDRPGGFGGLDLYISHKGKDGWEEPVNLGPEINTPFNEDRPFLINNDKTIFFSSQGHDNLGGYDIFRSNLQPNGLWNKPLNLGYPFNNPDDNFFFMPAGDGTTGYYSIFKDSSGKGKEDIYKITFTEK